VRNVFRVRSLCTLFNLHARGRAASGSDWAQVAATVQYLAHQAHRVHVGAFAQRPARIVLGLAQRSLDYAIAAVGVAVSGDVRQKLLAAYRTMDAYPEVAEVLAALKGRAPAWRSCRTAIPTCWTTPCARAKLGRLVSTSCCR